MSDYFHTLPSKEQVRYEEKLGLVGLKREDDPYLARNDSNYTDSMSLWPNVEYGHIFAYFIERPGIYTKEQLLSWKQLESYNYFHNGYVGPVRVWHFGHGKKKYCLLKAFVNPSQKAPKHGHNPWLIVTPQGQVVSAHCICMAGYVFAM